MKAALASTLILLLATPAALGQIWDEYLDGGGEAGELVATAQWTVGSGPLTAIIGADGGQDADLFAIFIPDPSAFSATLAANFSTQLWLFAPSGNGRAYMVDGSPTTLTGQFLPGPGLYYIAESRNGYLANSPGGLIWSGGPTGIERAPDGPGAPGPLTGWTGVTHHAFENYTINLQGAEYAPEPTTLTLLALGATMLLRRRRGQSAAQTDRFA
jgi:hypothetical protein